MNPDLTIIYYTDNSWDDPLGRIVWDELVKLAGSVPIVLVAPEVLWRTGYTNLIQTGLTERSHYNLFYHTFLGARKATTKYIAMAEHDCLYTTEHFSYLPPRDDIFYYNVNSWFVQWGGPDKVGEYSYYRRRPMSQLICDRLLYLRAMEEKLPFLQEGHKEAACEPGIKEYRQAMLRDDVGKSAPWVAEGFRTKLPNLDIRHTSNYSGPRLNSPRAKHHTYSLPPWGGFKEWVNERLEHNLSNPQQIRFGDIRILSSYAQDSSAGDSDYKCLARTD